MEANLITSLCYNRKLSERLWWWFGCPYNNSGLREVPVLSQGGRAAWAASLHRAAVLRERSGLLVEPPAGYCNPPDGKARWMCW